MSDSQKIIDRIRATMRSGDSAATEVVQELASEYQRLVQQVNNRLGRCGEYLKRGLRSEAVQLAEQTPDVLDQVSTLDFPEIENWLDMLETKRIKLPEELLFETAEELNESYGVVDQLDDVLKLHRRLALQRAPIKKRIQVIRQLEDLDIDTPFWADDLASYEQVRHAELATEISHFAKLGQRNEVDVRVSELLATGWSVEPAPATVKTALNIQQKVRSHSGRTDAVELAQALRQAHSELNLNAARKIRTEWLAAVADASLRDDDPLVERVRPIMQWLQDEDTIETTQRQTEEANDRLRDDLQTAKSSADLEQLANAAEVDGERPEALQKLYDDRLSELTSKERTHKLTLIAGSAIAILLSVGATFVMIRGMIRTDRAATAASSIRSAIEEGDLQTARKLFDENATYAGTDAWNAVSNELAETETTEAIRAKRFAVQLKLVESTQPNDEAVNEYLAEAQSLARTAAEKNRVEQLQQKLESSLRESQNAQKAQLASAMDDARRLLPIEQKSIADPDHPAEENLTKLYQQLDGIRSASHLLPPQDLTELNEAIEQLTELRRQRQIILSSVQITRRLDEYSQIDLGRANAPLQLEEYLEALAELAERPGSDSTEVRLKKTLNEDKQLWAGELAWAALVSVGGILPASTASTGERITEVQNWITAYPDSPTRSLAEQYLRVLKARERQGSVSSGIVEEARTFLENRLLSDCWQLILNDKTYYGPANLRQGESKFEWYEDWDGRRTKSRPFSGTRPVVIRAPQVKLVTALRQKLLGITPDAWENRLLPIALSIQNDTTVDSFLRFYRLRRICMDAQSGSEFLKTELADIQKIFETEHIVLSADWMNPDNQEANDARQIIETNLNPKLAGLDSAWKKAIEAQKSFRTRIAITPQSVGWLDLTRDGVWRCRTSYKAKQSPGLAKPELEKPDSANEQPIFVLSPTANQWQQIGSIDTAGKVVLTKDTTLLGHGRLVFVNVK